MPTRITPILIVSVILSLNANAQIVRFVDQSVNATSPDGTEWMLAYDNLQPAIDDVLANALGGHILVAEGTYEPEDPYPSSGNHSQKTYLIDGTLLDGAVPPTLGIHGGFLGYQGGTPGTDVYASPDGSFDNTTLRATAAISGFDGGYHVITVSGMHGKLELDGFTISRGYANGPNDSGQPDPCDDMATPVDPDHVGGGLRILRQGSLAASGDDGTILIENCLFKQNFALCKGGAIWIEIGALTAGRMTIRKTDFTKNSAVAGGAIFQSMDTLVSISNGRFKRNGGLVRFAREGGAIKVERSAETLVQNCVFQDNKSIDAGGAVHMTVPCISSDQGSWAFQNCTFAFNQSIDGAGGLEAECGPGGVVPSNQSIRFRVDNSVFWQNKTTYPTVVLSDVGVVGTLFQIYSDYSSFSSSGSIANPGVAAPASGVRLFGDPIFVDSAARNLRLKLVAFSGGGTSSPCIDAGNQLEAFMGKDRTDINLNSNFGELLPLDKDLETRVVNVPSAYGTGIVDMGAYEASNASGGGGL